MMTCSPTPIGRDQSFRFHCSPSVSCFNECCRNLNQFLTPYDIVRLKSHLDLGSGDFLARYTRWHIGPQTGLPIITLKEAESVHRTCPFLTTQGCSVYPHRPSSCRIYPLIRTVGNQTDSEQATEAFLLLKEPHCKGFEQDAVQSVDRWIADQGIAEYNRFNDELTSFIIRKIRFLSGPLEDSIRRRVWTALYDLDAFRSLIKERGQLGGIDIDKVEMDLAMNDDLVLLRLGLRWLNATLFDQKR